MIAGSYGKSRFSFVRSRQTAFQSAWAILHPCQQGRGVPVAPPPQQHLMFVGVLDCGHSPGSAVVSHCLNLHFLDGVL